MSRHLTKCKWCKHGAYSYKWGEWNCWYDERPLTDKEAKCGCKEHFTPNNDCPDSVKAELGIKEQFSKISLFKEFYE